MVATRSATVAAALLTAAPINLLKKLTDHGHGELLDLVAAATLTLHLPSALRLSQACTALRGRLAAVRAAAEARRLRWVPELTNTNKIAITDEGRAIVRVDGGGQHWAVSSLLPAGSATPGAPSRLARPSALARACRSRSPRPRLVRCCRNAGRPWPKSSSAH